VSEAAKSTDRGPSSAMLVLTGTRRDTSRDAFFRAARLAKCRCHQRPRCRIGESHRRCCPV